MSHRLIDAAPSNASELSAYVESLREHLLAHPEEWEQVTLDQYLEAFAAVLRDHQGPSPLGQSRLLDGHERESMPYAVLDCCMRPASTSSPDAPSVDPGEPERIRSSDRRQHRANTAFNFVLNQDYQRLSRSCRTERPPTQKTGRIPQRLERLAGSSRFQNESTADRVVLKVKIESFSKCRNQQTQALSRVVFKVSPQHHPKTQDLVGLGLMRAQQCPGLGRALRELEPVGDQAPYAVAMSGKTASILVFSVAALNGLTM
jgi:hypothetical protein